MNARRSGRSLLRERVFLITAVSPLRTALTLPFFVETSDMCFVDSGSVEELEFMFSNDVKRRLVLLLLLLKLPAFGGGVGCGGGSVSNNNRDDKSDKGNGTSPVGAQTTTLRGIMLPTRGSTRRDGDGGCDSRRAEDTVRS